MAEEMTSDVASDAPSTTDSAPVESGQSTEQAQTISTEPQPQTESNAAPEQSGKPEYVSQKDFRSYQSSRDTQLRDLRGQWQAREQQLTQMAQQAQAAKEAAEDANLDDYQKAEKRAERAETKLYQFQQQTQAKQYQDNENQRMLDDMQRIHDKTGIPLEELYTASSYDDALDMGIAHMKENGANQDKQHEVQREANRTVVGGGRASTPTSRREKDLDAVMKGKGTPADYLRLLREDT